MGRTAQGVTIYWRGPERGYTARATIEGERYEVSTGVKVKRDKAKARAAGERRIGEAASRRRRGAAVPVEGERITEAGAQWLESLSDIRQRTRLLYEKYAGLGWGPEFRTTSGLTSDRLRAYVRRRLREARGKTVRNELSALRRFCAFCVEMGWLRELPEFPSAAITHMLERGAPLPGVQYMAGHKYASTTAIYVRPSLRAAQEAVRLSGTKTGTGRKKKAGAA